MAAWHIWQETFCNVLSSRTGTLNSHSPSSPWQNLPRPFILKLLHAKHQDNILSMAHTKGTVEINGSKISFFSPDFSVEVQKMRAQYTDVNCHLHALQLSYIMLYQAKLHAVVQGEVRFLITLNQLHNGWIETNSIFLLLVLLPDMNTLDSSSTNSWCKDVLNFICNRRHPHVVSSLQSKAFMYACGCEFKDWPVHPQWQPIFSPQWFLRE